MVTPDSASGLARKLEMTRQKLNYHLREMEKQGLVELFEEKKKGNCTERLVRATARSYLLRPEIIAMVSNFVSYANANKSATPLVNKFLTGHPGIYPDAEVFKRLSTVAVLGPKLERRRSRTWTRIKTGL